jgi:Trk K+ transport system NAD-binding subunit
MQTYASWIIIRRLRIPLIVIIVTFTISILGMMIIPGVDAEGKVYHLNFFDAFYFVSYMASTIGFGESPYDFTYPQKLWVSFSIYLTVVGWFYGIGTIVALIQDKILSVEISRSKFIRDIKGLNEPFILIIGYNNVTKNLIKRLDKIPKRMVVIDVSEANIDALDLENYHPRIPAFHGDLFDSAFLEMAGLRSPMCESIVIVFDKENKNTKIAMMCKYLNPQAKIILRSNTQHNNDYLNTMGITHIENPFKVISSRLYLAIKAPHLWMLEMWVHGHPLHISKKEKIPPGKFVIFGYGRMGKSLEEGLSKAGVKYSFIDASELFSNKHKLELVFSEKILESRLIDAGIDDAAVVVAGTREDMINLAVIMLSKKHNPNIYTIARENFLTDLSVFKAAKIDRNYILEEIVANKTYNYIAMPLANAFISNINERDDEWGEKVVNKIINKMGRKPHLCEMSVTYKQAFALYNSIKNGTKISLKILKRSRSDYKKNNALIFLLVKRKGVIHLLPSDDFLLEIDDEMLIVCNKESEVDLAYILNNYYELHYVINGKELYSGIQKLFFHK